MQTEAYDYYQNSYSEGMEQFSSASSSDKNSKEAFFDSRYHSISELFLGMDIQMTDYLPERDFLRLLDSLCVNEFDREIATGLFSKVPKYPNPERPSEKVLEVQEFVYTFIKAEYLLLTKAEQINGKLAEISNQVRVVNKQISYMKAQGANYRVPLEGTQYNLNLEIGEVVNDDYERKYSPNNRYTAVVKYGGSKYETMEVKNDGLEFNPRFGHTFHIKISNLKDKLTLSLRKYEDPKNRMSYNESTATVVFDLASRNRGEFWVDLYDDQGACTQEKMLITMELQLENTLGIEHFNDQIQKLEAFEKQILKERKLIYTSLRDLVEPFSVRGNRSQKRSRISQQVTYFEKKDYKEHRMVPKVMV